MIAMTAHRPASLLDRYCRVRAATEAVCAPLSAEDMVVQSMTDTSPTKWHLAHSSWFFETFILSDTELGGYRPFDPAFNYLFNSYYEAVGPRHPRPKRGLLTRPTAVEVFEYRHHVDAAMNGLLLRIDEPKVDRFRDLIELGLNHEQQHLELILTDIKHAFAQNPLRPAYVDRQQPRSSAASPITWIDFDSGVRSIGHEGDGFAFDNEGPRHRVFLEPFAIATRPATCGEYLAFINDGGYSRPELWLSDGWHVLQSNGWEAPLYWEWHGTCWNLFTLNGTQTLDENEPICHLSFYEADAFARWSEARLPTEAEWEVGCAAPAHVDAEQRYGPLRIHPTLEPSESRSTPSTFGEVWEWTQSAYGPYPGYRSATGPLGEYNGKFMCNQMVLRGGSCLTPRSHLRPTYRNFFPPEARWQFTGLRLARSN